MRSTTAAGRWSGSALGACRAPILSVTRETIDGKNPAGWLPRQKTTVEQALTAYTVNNAYAGFQDGQLGRLALGYVADITVLDRNLLTISPDEIRRASALRTIVGGRERFVENAGRR